MIDCEEAIFNTDISNVDEYVEIDVEKIKEVLERDDGNFVGNMTRLEIACTIASTRGVMNWRK